MVDRVGELFGNYRLVQLLGQGGFATVYLGEHIYLRSRAAIKVLSTQLTDDAFESFRVEARTIATLEHPNIVRIIDFGVQQGSPFFVMEYAPSGSLRQRHPTGSIIPLTTVISYVNQIAGALQYAHDSKLIHRDIKPENMLFTQNGTVILSDFGVAIMAQSTHSLKTTDFAGTISYMAPEQIEGKPRPASDQYALGMVVYEWLTGDRPFHGTLVELVAQHLYSPPPSLYAKNPMIPPGIEDVVLRSLNKDPAQRFSSVLAFADALQGVSERAIPSVILEDQTSLSSVPQRLGVASASLTMESFANREDVQPSQSKRSLISNIKEYVLRLFFKAKQPSLSSSLVSDKPPPIGSDNLAVSNDPLKDFFISYARVDHSWAKWIKWHLDKARYSTILLPWGVRSNFAFEKEMQEALTRAKRVIVVLSPNYLNALSIQTTLIDIFQQMETKNLLLVHVQECDHEFKKRLEAINYIDLSVEDETVARSMLLAGVRSEGIQLAIQPAFPGEVGDKVPTFPGKGIPSSDPFNLTSNIISNSNISSYSITTVTSLIQQTHIAFVRKDWSDVIRKIDHISKVAPDSLSAELYHMQGQAFLENGDKQRARESLHTALALVTNHSQRLMLLEEYAGILASLDRWSEVLNSTKEALSLAPHNTMWQQLQQQSITQSKIIERAHSQAKPQAESSFTQMASPTKSLEVFFSYSHKDAEMRLELEKYLSNLKRQRSISGWYDGEIGPGKEWEQEIDKHLDQANIILLLVSQDFIASDYCYETEMMRALEKHRVGTACIVPIILRPAHWEATHFGKLQALPVGGKPITLWTNRDEAFLNVAKGIQKVVDRLTKNSLL